MRTCDVCGRPMPHIAHADKNDGKQPADPPFERTRADDIREGKVRA